MVCPSLSCSINVNLKSTLSDISITTPACFGGPFSSYFFLNISINRYYNEDPRVLSSTLSKVTLILNSLLITLGIKIDPLSSVSCED
jgi:hypothetical protein